MSLQQLRDTHDAVFLGLGMGGTNGLNIPGEDLPGVEDAVDYISELRQIDSLGKLPVGKNIVVIGAGMTAIDIAVQSKKLGAADVVMVYRRDKPAMGASKHEQELAQTNGVRFVFNAQPKQILGDENGINSMEFTRTLTNQQGKLVATQEVISLPCDVVFKAIGQKIHPSFLQQDTERPNLCKSGRLAVDDSFQTSIPRVYAGGDCIKGKDLVVEAVDHGNKAALAIHQLMQQEEKH